MKQIATSFCVGAALCLSGLSVAAQDSQEIETQQDETQTSEFRTFDPSEEEWETFRSSGKITHEEGEAVYNAVCAGCHMPQGEGANGAGAYPALADNELLASPSYPIYLILEGQAAMPPFGNMLDDQQIANVVNYIRSSFDNDFIDEHGEATADQVEETRQ